MEAPLLCSVHSIPITPCLLALTFALSSIAPFTSCSLAYSIHSLHSLTQSGVIVEEVQWPPQRSNVGGTTPLQDSGNSGVTTHPSDNMSNLTEAQAHSLPYVGQKHGTEIDDLDLAPDPDLSHADPAPNPYNLVPQPIGGMMTDGLVSELNMVSEEWFRSRPLSARTTWFLNRPPAYERELPGR